MKRVFVYILIGVLVVIAGMVGFYYGLIAFVGYQLRPTHVVVAADVSISSKWKELRPDSALKVEKQTQTVFLIINGYKYEVGEDFRIELSDGTIVKPEIEVIDEFGNVFELKDTTRVGSMVGFTPREFNSGSGTFPADRSYAAIRIRSDKPFRCSKVLWTNKNLK